jgi:hypothetical protein
MHAYCSNTQTHMLLDCQSFLQPSNSIVEIAVPQRKKKKKKIRVNTVHTRVLPMYDFMKGVGVELGDDGTPGYTGRMFSMYKDEIYSFSQAPPLPVLPLNAEQGSRGPGGPPLALPT